MTFKSDHDSVILRRYVSSVRRGTARRTRVSPPPGSLSVSLPQALAFRSTSTHLPNRLPQRNLTIAAWGGLQDSAPRAGLLSLHARVEKVRPDSWEDPELAQIWFRGADYIIPRVDTGIFTLGCLPRDVAVIAALERVAGDLIEHTTTDQPRPEALLSARIAQVTGRFLIRWDASRTTVNPIGRPDCEPEWARKELVRRFLHWYAPATVDQFAKWAGVTVADARESWNGLATEMLDTDFEGAGASALTADEDTLRNPAQASTIRFLPASDPYLYLDRKSITGEKDVAELVASLNQRYESRLVNSLAGRVFSHGRSIGAWGRVGATLSIITLPTLDDRSLEAIEDEACRMTLPIGRTMNLNWLSRHGAV